jgi:integrase
MPKIAKPLTAMEVKQLNKPGLHSVGTVAGLSLVIKPTGAKSWILRVKFGDQRSDLGLGAYPEVTLAVAHEKARQKKELIRQGINPLHEQKTLKQAVLWTFKRCAEVYIESHKAEWTNAKHEAQWPSTLKKYVYPVFGDKPVKDVSQKDVLSVVQAEWLTKNVSMRRVLNRIESVLGWAAAMGYRNKENPATWKNNLDHLLAEPKKFVKKTHFKALSYNDMAALMKRLKSVEGFSARCLEFAILTASRSGEVRGCTWSEIDLEAAEWSISPERMKGKRPHRIPLSTQALELLAGLPRIEGSDLVFPGRGQGQLSDMSLNAVLRRLEVPAVQHGFRSTFTDWAAEKTNHPSEVREMALAHAISNDTEASYRRGDLFDKRRALMNDWADYVFYKT